MHSVSTPSGGRMNGRRLCASARLSTRKDASQLTAVDRVSLARLVRALYIIFKHVILILPVLFLVYT